MNINPLICQRCGFANSSGAQFCGRCGRELPADVPSEQASMVSCPQCGTPNDPEAAFCGECGWPMASTPVAPGHAFHYPAPPMEQVWSGRRWLLLLLPALALLLAMGAFLLIPRLQSDSGSTIASLGGEKKDIEDSGLGQPTPTATDVNDDKTSTSETPKATETATLAPKETTTQSPSATATATITPSPTPAADEFIIDATMPRTFTGYQVAAGQTVTVEFLSGEWRAGPAPTWSMGGPAGDTQVPSKPSFPSPLSSMMTLVAGTGPGRAVPVGDGATFTSDIGGELWLGPNDDDPTDNAGSLRVRVTLGEMEPVTIIPLEGVGLVQLTFGSELDYTPSLSPDQTRLVVASEIGGRWTLVEVDVNGSGQVSPLVNDSTDFQAPHFSPDGRTLLAAGSRGGGGRDIYLLDGVNGEVLTRLTDMPGDEYSPRWLADGSGFVFSWRQDDLEGIYLQRMDGERVELVRSTTFDGFAWPSPDGRRVAYYSGRDGDYEIYVMDIDGGNPRRLTVSPGRDASPVWSLDGQWIAFESDRNGTYDLFVMRADGNDVQQLTSGSGNDFFPYFSPDGRWLLFQSDRTGNMDIFRMSFEP